jgi:hypothetical protein
MSPPRSIRTFRCIGPHHQAKLRVFIAYRERDLYILGANAN